MKGLMVLGALLFSMNGYSEYLLYCKDHAEVVYRGVVVTEREIRESVLPGKQVIKKVHFENYQIAVQVKPDLVPEMSIGIAPWDSDFNYAYTSRKEVDSDLYLEWSDGKNQISCTLTRRSERSRNLVTHPRAQILADKIWSWVKGCGKSDFDYYTLTQFVQSKVLESKEVEIAAHQLGLSLIPRDELLKKRNHFSKEWWFDSLESEECIQEREDLMKLLKLHSWDMKSFLHVGKKAKGNFTHDVALYLGAVFQIKLENNQALLLSFSGVKRLD